jgi:hypothetical protein
VGPGSAPIGPTHVDGYADAVRGRFLAAMLVRFVATFASSQ